MNEEALRQPGLSLRYAFLIGTAAIVVAADQLSKAWVSNDLQGRAPIELFGGLVRLVYTRNTGAAFSMLPTGGVIFETVAVLVCLGILVAYPRLSQSSALVRVALGLVLGGAAGNLIDRVRLGYVVDFVDLGWWPVFNVADSAVVVGAILLILHSFLDSRRAEQ